MMHLEAAVEAESHRLVHRCRSQERSFFSGGSGHVARQARCESHLTFTLRWHMLHRRPSSQDGFIETGIVLAQAGKQSHEGRQPGVIAGRVKWTFPIGLSKPLLQDLRSQSSACSASTSSTKQSGTHEVWLGLFRNMKTRGCNASGRRSESDPLA